MEALKEKQGRRREGEGGKWELNMRWRGEEVVGGEVRRWRDEEVGDER